MYTEKASVYPRGDIEMRANRSLLDLGFLPDHVSHCFIQPFTVETPVKVTNKQVTFDRLHIEHGEMTQPGSLIARTDRFLNQTSNQHKQTVAYFTRSKDHNGI